MRSYTFSLRSFFTKACDDWDKMIKGDTGMESVFTSTPEVKHEIELGATGSIDGVHILT